MWANAEVVPGARTQHRHQRRFGNPGDFADRGDPYRVQLLRRLRANSPEPFDRQWVEEGEFGAGADDQQAVRLADAAGDLGQEFGASDADRDRKADPFADCVTELLGDLGRRARDPPQSAHIEECFVDGYTFHEWGRVLEHLEHRPAGGGVGIHPGWDDDGLWAEPERLACAHRAPDAMGPGLVAGGEHDPAAHDHRPAPEVRGIALLHRRVERIEVSMKD